MSSKKFDIVLLTDKRYVNPTEITPYIANVLLEDKLLTKKLINSGLKVHRTNWDNPEFDWTTTKTVLFRATWDYFERINEFLPWLESVKEKTQLINDYSTIKWNLDKHYLNDLAKKGINIPNSTFIEQGNSQTLYSFIEKLGYKQFILKPAVSGAGRHTYKINFDEVLNYEKIFKELTHSECMIIQEYQQNITTKGEIALVFFGKNYSHSVLKMAKKGDFRVQDDFGGTIVDYIPNKTEIEFASAIISSINPTPAYARIDLIWDNNNELCLSELELIEPELWFRNNKNAANKLTQEIINILS